MPAWVLGFALLPLVAGLNDGLAVTPLLGWNSWNSFHDDVNETLIKETADLLVSTGLAGVGFDYLIIDDGWASRKRAVSGPIQHNTTRFPSGIATLADYVHGKGLKLGMYTDSGSMTCAKYSGSLGFEKEDAAQLAEWEIDLLKHDNCFSVPEKERSVQARYEDMRDALNATGRPIVFSVCEWGVSSPWLYGREVGHMWRTGKDISIAIEASWDGVMQNLDDTTGLSRFAGPGGWNDADMLAVGKPVGNRLSHTEQRAHFALWALIKSPLIIGADLRALSRETLLLLKSREVVAINQDPLGVAGDRVWKQGPKEVWAAPLKGGARAVILFNRHVASDDNFPATEMTVYWSNIGLPNDAQATVRDLFKERDLGVFTGSFSSVVDNHGVIVLRIATTRPTVGLEAWRPWICDPSVGDACVQDSEKEEMGRATQALQQEVGDEQARVTGLRQREAELQAAVARLEAQAAADADASAQRVHQAVDRKNLVVVLALGVASGCVLGFLAAAVFLQCSWAAAHLAAAAGAATLSPRFSGCQAVLFDEQRTESLGNGRRPRQRVAFHDEINETLIKETADLVVSLGLREAGYNFVNLDDGWAQRTRNGSQPIMYNETRFPNGIRALADYMHAKGLKLGIYSDSGNQTCAGYTASLGYEKEDAAQFAAWGVDLLKYDNCWTVSPEVMTVQARFEAMRDALNATGRAMLYCMCEWGVSSPWLYAQQVGNSWRTTQDISLNISASWAGILENLDANTGLARFAGPGAWNDADMLELGLPGGLYLTGNEATAHMALWSIIKSPLIFGADLRLMDNVTLGLLTAPELIAFNQDPLGVAGELVWKQGPTEVYACPLDGGSRAVVLFNRHVASDGKFGSHNITIFWKSIGLPPTEAATVRDVLLRKDLGSFTGTYTGPVSTHSVLALKITPLRRIQGADDWRPWICNKSIGMDCGLQRVSVKSV
ncbi:hypothetical protein WJX81_004261 [Elliptochloris bilobata]|uniref:Alpha-galactosidase n=1 Tax=Elliptochloris bilobata TaxID=381761 RepID=A0AAW1QXA0_9CHLO